MARISGISKNVLSAEPLKLLALVFDIFILLVSTGDDVNKCQQGYSSSSATDRSSTLDILLTFAILFLIAALVVLIIKYSFWCIMKRHCNRCQGQGKCDCSEYDICCCSCTKCENPGRVCTCTKCATNEGKCCCCMCDKIVTFTVNSCNLSQCSHSGNDLHECSKVCQLCGLTGPNEIRKMKCYKCLKISAFIFYDLVSILMGVFFLLGNNLTDDICVFCNCGNFNVNSSTCKLLENHTIDKGGKIYNHSNCTNEFAIKCRRASVAFLGSSTILNIFLSYLTFKSIYDKGLPSIGKQHKLWITTLSLLSLIIIIDQTTTGLYTSVFKLTRNETNQCSDLDSIHWSASITYVFGILVWIIILIWHCCENWPEKGGSQCSPFWNSLVLFLFYIVYIFVDTPWPWDCFETNDIYNKKAGIVMRFVLAIIVSLLIVWFAAIYIIIVAIPALRVQKNAELVLNDENIKDDLRRWTRRKNISLREEGSHKLIQSETFNENITSASYEISIIKDYDWQTELKEICSRNN